METTYKESAPTRAEIDALAGPAVLEFGTNWCGYCRAAQPPLAEAYADHALAIDWSLSQFSLNQSKAT